MTGTAPRRGGWSAFDAAALILLWALPASVPRGLIAEDTKNDLFVDPWGFMARALHLWDPQVTWGVLQNQAYGYLFPMGPFFGITSAVMPMWLAQRLWWGLIFTAAYLGMRSLLCALAVTSPRLSARSGSAVLAAGALAYAVSPRLVSTAGGLSGEGLPTALAPAILAPLVWASRGRLSPRRAALWSGLAVLACGGVNAVAVGYAALPAVLWVLTRRRWWRSALTGWTAAAMLAATSWWLAPLVLLGRYSPPFLDWIETSRAVSDPVGLLDVVRGTTHWLSRVFLPGGPWWPAASSLSGDPVLIVATTVIAAVGLWGLARPRAPHRGFLWLLLALGVLLLAVPHAGPLASPLAEPWRDLLDGPLAPLRNIHKADPLVRLPLVVGFARALTLAVAWSPRRATWRRPVTLLGSVAAVILVAGAGVSPGIAVRGAFPGIPAYWSEAAEWLQAQGGQGPALLVPSSSFAEYRWGRTIDEPLRALTPSPYAVRDAVPLTPAGTIRLLDEVELRGQSGTELEGAVAALRSTGVRHVVLRNDLDSRVAMTVPVAFTRATLQGTPGVERVAQFGPPTFSESGELVRPIEIYDLGEAAPTLQTFPTEAVVAASGASEALPLLREAGVEGPVLFDGDATPALIPQWRWDTDSYRARDRFFGALRGRDATSSLYAAQDLQARDYRPWEDPALRSRLVSSGVTEVSASSSLATTNTLFGLWPAYGPAAVLDADPRTAWVTPADGDPTLRLTLDGDAAVDRVHLTPYRDRTRFGEALAVADTATVRWPGGAVTGHADAPGADIVIDLPSPASGWLSVTVTSQQEGAGGLAVTGLSEVSLKDVPVTTAVSVASPRIEATTAGVVLSTGAPLGDGCVGRLSLACWSEHARPAEETTLRRELPAVSPGSYAVRGTVRAVSDAVPPQVSAAVGIEVSASSTATVATRGGPWALVDGDPKTSWSPSFADVEPWFSVRLPAPTTISQLRLTSDGSAAASSLARVRVVVDGVSQDAAVDPSGGVALNPVTGQDVRVTVLRTLERSRTAGVRLTSFEISTQPWPSVPRSWDWACGEGPSLSIDGSLVPTRGHVDWTRAVGGAPVEWEACGSFVVAGDGPHRVELAGPAGFAAGTVILTADSTGSPTGSVGAPVAATRTTPTSLAATLTPAAGDRVLVTVDNVNPGWQARVGTTRLSPVTIDGFRQGFVVPAGLGGDLLIEFAPDRLYRLALAGGALLAAGLVSGVVLAWRRSQSRSRSASRAAGLLRLDSDLSDAAVADVPAGLVGVAGLAVGTLLLGWPGLLVALGAIGVGLALGRWWRARGVVALSVVALVVCAGLIQAVLSPGGVGPAWLETGSRLVLSAAVALAAVLAWGPEGAALSGADPGAPTDPARPSQQRSLDEDVAGTCQGEGDRDTDHKQRHDPPGEGRDPGHGKEGHEDGDMPQEDAVGDASKGLGERMSEH